MADHLSLLSDEQVQQFIAQGYLTVQADYPASFHRDIYQEIETVFETDGNLGNNILPRIPKIGHVFEHPNVKGALTSLLGPGYVMNPHRHCHLNPPGGKGQRWHKDCYVFDHNVRHPRFYWVFGFYYPQDTTPDMGPTGLLSHRHTYKTISDPDASKTTETAVPLCGPAGTVALVHFDAWHRATQNVSDKKRYMLKFQFARMCEPEAPMWHHQSRAWAPGAGDLHPEISEDVWHWLCGERKKKSGVGASVKTAIGNLSDDSETARLKAAYDLAQLDGDAVVPLIAAMKAETLATVEETEAKTPDNAHGTNPTMGYAAQALSVMGASAVSALVPVLHDDHWWVRAVAANVLGRMGYEAQSATPALVALLKDEHWWVRRNAAEALRLVGATSETHGVALALAVGDPDYRVRRSTGFGRDGFKSGCSGVCAGAHAGG